VFEETLSSKHSSYVFKETLKFLQQLTLAEEKGEIMKSGFI
jgi:hypothetical protein